MKLDKYLRPKVVFDVANPEHRKHYFAFLDSKTWSRCPYQFITGATEDSPVLTVAIEQQLLRYYRDMDRQLALRGQSLVDLARTASLEDDVNFDTEANVVVAELQQ